MNIRLLPLLGTFTLRDMEVPERGDTDWVNPSAARAAQSPWDAGEGDCIPRGPCSSKDQHSMYWRGVSTSVCCVHDVCMHASRCATVCMLSAFSMCTNCVQSQWSPCLQLAHLSCMHYIYWPTMSFWACGVYRAMPRFPTPHQCEAQACLSLFFLPWSPKEISSLLNLEWKLMRCWATLSSLSQDFAVLFHRRTCNGL